MMTEGIPRGSDSRDVPLDIALAEYEHLRASRQVSFDGSGKRFNFYLVVVAASPAALTLAAGAAPRGNIWISGTLLLAVFGLGLVTFRRLLEFDYWSTYYTRGLNHLRSYFLQRAEDLSEYFVLPVTDDRPSFVDRHGLAIATGFINSVVVGVSVGIGAAVFYQDNIAVGLPTGLFTLTLSWLLHVGYALFMRERFQIRYQDALLVGQVPLRGAEVDESLSPTTISESLARPIAGLLRLWKQSPNHAGSNDTDT
jgi:hypothetical protein